MVEKKDVMYAEVFQLSCEVPEPPEITSDKEGMHTETVPTVVVVEKKKPMSETEAANVIRKYWLLRFSKETALKLFEEVITAYMTPMTSTQKSLEEMCAHLNNLKTIQLVVKAFLRLYNLCSHAVIVDGIHNDESKELVDRVAGTTYMLYMLYNSFPIAVYNKASFCNVFVEMDAEVVRVAQDFNACSMGLLMEFVTGAASNPTLLAGLKIEDARQFVRLFLDLSHKVDLMEGVNVNRIVPLLKKRLTKLYGKCYSNRETWDNAIHRSEMKNAAATMDSIREKIEVLTKDKDVLMEYDKQRIAQTLQNSLTPIERFGCSGDIECDIFGDMGVSMPGRGDVSNSDVIGHLLNLDARYRLVYPPRYGKHKRSYDINRIVYMSRLADDLLGDGAANRPHIEHWGLSVHATVVIFSRSPAAFCMDANLTVFTNTMHRVLELSRQQFVDFVMRFSESVAPHIRRNLFMSPHWMPVFDKEFQNLSNLVERVGRYTSDGATVLSSMLFFLSEWANRPRYELANARLDVLVKTKFESGGVAWERERFAVLVNTKKVDLVKVQAWLGKALRNVLIEEKKYDISMVYEKPVEVLPQVFKHALLDLVFGFVSLPDIPDTLYFDTVYLRAMSDQIDYLVDAVCVLVGVSKVVRLPMPDVAEEELYVSAIIQRQCMIPGAGEILEQHVTDAVDNALTPEILATQLGQENTEMEQSAIRELVRQQLLSITQKIVMEERDAKRQRVDTLERDELLEVWNAVCKWLQERGDGDITMTDIDNFVFDELEVSDSLKEDLTRSMRQCTESSDPYHAYVRQMVKASFYDSLLVSGVPTMHAALCFTASVLKPRFDKVVGALIRIADLNWKVHKLTYNLLFHAEVRKIK